MAKGHLSNEDVNTNSSSITIYYKGLKCNCSSSYACRSSSTHGGRKTMVLSSLLKSAASPLLPTLIALLANNSHSKLRQRSFLIINPHKSPRRSTRRSPPSTSFTDLDTGYGRQVQGAQERESQAIYGSGARCTRRILCKVRRSVQSWDAGVEEAGSKWEEEGKSKEEERWWGGS